MNTTVTATVPVGLNEAGAEVFTRIIAQLVRDIQVEPNDAAALITVAWKMALWESVAEAAVNEFGPKSEKTRFAQSRIRQMRQLLVEVDKAAGREMPPWMLELADYGPTSH